MLAELQGGVDLIRRRRQTFIEKAQQLGADVVACSDSRGYVVDDKGLDLPLLQQVKTVERGSLADYAERRGGSARTCA